MKMAAFEDFIHCALEKDQWRFAAPFNCCHVDNLELFWKACFQFWMCTDLKSHCTYKGNYLQLLSTKGKKSTEAYNAVIKNLRWSMCCIDMHIPLYVSVFHFRVRWQNWGKQLWRVPPDVQSRWQSPTSLVKTAVCGSQEGPQTKKLSCREPSTLDLHYQTMWQFFWPPTSLEATPFLT